MFTDSHCHLASDKFPAEEIPLLIARAKDAGVDRLVTLATDPEDITQNLALAEKHPEIHACLGIHPCDVQNAPDDFEALLNPLLDHPKVVAVGETGLDYYHPAPDGWTTEDYHARQRDFLRRHFRLAAKHRLNLVIHTRDREGNQSLDDALDIYREFHEEVTAVFHCFPGPYELAEPILALGGLISFTGIATFKNAAICLEAAARVPEDQFMLETDAPYLAPVPHRGKRNEPAFLALTAQTISEARKVDLATLLQQTEKTAEQFFRFATIQNFP